MRGTLNFLSGGASRWVALRNGGIDTHTPLGSDAVPEEEEEEQEQEEEQKEEEEEVVVVVY